MCLTSDWYVGVESVFVVSFALARECFSSSARTAPCIGFSLACTNLVSLSRRYMLHYVYTMFSQPATLSGYAVWQRLSQARSELGSLSPVTPSVCPVLFFVHRSFSPGRFCSSQSQFLDWGDRGFVRDDIQLLFPSGSLDWVASLSYT